MKDSADRLQSFGICIRPARALSYNDCPEIRKLYEGYYFYDFKRVHSMVQKYDPGKEFPELLIANYDLTEKAKNFTWQIDLFTPIEAIKDIDTIMKESIKYNEHL